MASSSPTQSGGGLTTPGRMIAFLQAGLIILLGFWIHWPALHGGWLWDDHFYVPQNALLHDPARLWKTWFEPGHLIEYYPIEQTLQYVQWQLWHEDTFGYHVCNVVLHLVNALLVWKLLSKFGLRLAWLGGLIFAIHPVMVESVAWIAEFKNTLSQAPFLLAMCFFIDYEEHGRRRDYLLTLGLFLIAMLCKISMAPFPVTMLLYAWWKRGRIVWSDVRASLPFLVISLLLGMATIYAGIRYREIHPGPDETVPLTGLLPRLACAGMSLSFYLGKSIWPTDLSFFYPKWMVDAPSAEQLLPGAAWAGVFALLWVKRTGWGRHGLLGLGFFVLYLLPFIGLITSAFMRFTWVMNHFIYLPIIGLIGLAVAGLDQLQQWLSPPLRLGGAGLIAVAGALMVGESHAATTVFADEISLWNHTLEYVPESWAAHNGLGTALLQEGRLNEAVVQFQEAIQFNPAYADPHTNLAAILLRNGDATGAIAQFELALRINPKDADVHYDLGNAYFQTGRMSEAIQEFNEALRIEPGLAEAHYNLGNALVQANQIPEAAEQYEQALAINPDHEDAHANLGNVLLQLDRVSDAMEQYAQALRLDPHDVQTRDNLGLVLLHIDRAAEAKEQFAEVLRLAPNDTTAQNNLARIDAAEKGTSPQH